MTGLRNQLMAAAAAATAVGAFAAPAFAADMGGDYDSYKPPAAAYSPPPMTWAGWYLGGHLGGTVDGDGEFVGGGHLGHNWQTGKWVYGVEGDISTGDDIDYLSSVRGRLGLGSSRWLVYGTAGVGFVNAEQDYVTFGGVPFSNDETETGFVGGGGIEYKVAEQSSLGVEALHYTFEDDDPIGAFSSDDMDFTVVRGRLTYHFGGPSY